MTLKRILTLFIAPITFNCLSAAQDPLTFLTEQADSALQKSFNLRKETIIESEERERKDFIEEQEKSFTKINETKRKELESLKKIILNKKGVRYDYVLIKGTGHKNFSRDSNYHTWYDSYGKTNYGEIYNCNGSLMDTLNIYILFNGSYINSQIRESIEVLDNRICINSSNKKFLEKGDLIYTITVLPTTS